MSGEASLLQSVKHLDVSQFIGILAECEIWRQVRGYPSYEVSSFGSVRRCGSADSLRLPENSDYYLVSLSESGVVKTVRVHKIVALTFLGDAPFQDAVVAHNDGNTKNNHITNLRWASAKENQRDRVRHHTHTFGSDVHNSKLKEIDIPMIRARINSGERYPSIANDYGVSVSTISLIKKGKIWNRANGAAWRPQHA